MDQWDRLDKKDWFWKDLRYSAADVLVGPGNDELLMMGITYSYTVKGPYPARCRRNSISNIIHR